jgi:hypothetical protein
MSCLHKRLEHLLALKSGAHLPGDDYLTPAQVRQIDVEIESLQAQIDFNRHLFDLSKEYTNGLHTP